LHGEEVIIASHGKAQVKLLPCVFSTGLKRPDSLVGVSLDLTSAQVDAAACLLAGPATDPAADPPTLARLFTRPLLVAGPPWSSLLLVSRLAGIDLA